MIKRAKQNQHQRPDWRSLPMIGQWQHLFQTGELSDCSFLVGKDGEQAERIAAHKLILCRASEVFNLMFTGPMQEKGEVRVKDISPRDFKAMLMYIYTENLNLSDLDMSLQVMMAANKYLIVPLVNKCVEFATEKMQPGDVCRVLHVANLLENKHLEQAALEMLQKKTEEVISASSWVDSPSSVVLTVLQQDSLNVSSELSLLTACDQWSRHHVSTDQTARDVLDQFLPYLRLRTLTTEQFIKITDVEDCVFTAEECMQVLRCIVTPGLKMCSVCDLTVSRIAPQVSGKVEDLMSVVVRYGNNKDMCRLQLHDASGYTLSPLVLHQGYHMLLCGVQYCPISASTVDILDRLMIETNHYQLSFTVQLIEEETKACVTALEYEGTVSYGSDKMDLLFPQPYLLKKRSQVEVKVTYHTEVNGKHQQFSAQKPGTYIYNIYIGLIGISQVLYKKID